jgi:hypothetical protein
MLSSQIGDITTKYTNIYRVIFNDRVYHLLLIGFYLLSEFNKLTIQTHTRILFPGT